VALVGASSTPPCSRDLRHQPALRQRRHAGGPAKSERQHVRTASRGAVRSWSRACRDRWC